MPRRNRWIDGLYGDSENGNLEESCESEFPSFGHSLPFRFRLKAGTNVGVRKSKGFRRAQPFRTRSSLVALAFREIELFCVTERKRQSYGNRSLNVPTSIPRK